MHRRRLPTPSTSASTTYASSWSTAGPWGPKAQHAGPPSALLAMQLQNAHPHPGFHPARMAFELLGQIPVADLTIRTTVEHSTNRRRSVRDGLGSCSSSVNRTPRSAA
ncbi:acyl-CoA thioesterase domain-containing protein [Streptomyces lydicus]|uniref:acyl-CoA thioesterase domain-containing protein n=1 Tax=Streptomyces lydicus TaxID=47763 RepID=UPI0034A04B65